jgi:hypothetical protein
MKRKNKSSKSKKSNKIKPRIKVAPPSKRHKSKKDYNRNTPEFLLVDPTPEELQGLESRPVISGTLPIFNGGTAQTAFPEPEVTIAGGGSVAIPVTDNSTCGVETFTIIRTLLVVTGVILYALLVRKYVLGL